MQEVQRVRRRIRGIPPKKRSRSYMLQKGFQLFNMLDAVARSGVFKSKELDPHNPDTNRKPQSLYVLFHRMKHNSEFSPYIYGSGMGSSKGLFCSYAAHLK
jgi:hypothetical protein